MHESSSVKYYTHAVLHLFFSVCFTDPQVSQYCAGMESYKYFFEERTGK